MLYLATSDSCATGVTPDFVRAQWLMLQQEQADDFVIATGEQHSVREFVTRAGELPGQRLSGAARRR
jgi:GDPmannose 4,6-dehydratase